MNLIGFGIGVLLETPKITFTISSPSIETTWRGVSAKVVFLWTNIIAEYYDHNESFKGYTLFGPEYSTKTYLIDNNGEIIHTWQSDYTDCLGHYLLENGNLIRMCLPEINPVFAAGGMGGMSGRVEMFDKYSNLLWEFEYTNEDHCLHHDIEPLPNGNILMIAWEVMTESEAIAAGRDPNKVHDSLWPNHIIEVEPTGSSGGNIVWGWHSKDHLIQDFDPTKDNYGVVEDHPELIDFNYGWSGKDLYHINSVDYNEEFDQILLSCHNFNEIWIIDHSTTTEEAAGHTGGNSGKGGDLLYRWGNPQAYRAGTANDRKYFNQHGANWVESGCPGEGNILVFNNGGMDREYSSVDEIVPPVDEDGYYSYTPGSAYGPDEQIWIYTTDPPHDLRSMIMSSAQRLPNGNTLICSAMQGLFLEVTPDKEIVWQYMNLYPNPSANAVFKAYRFPLDFPGIP